MNEKTMQLDNATLKAIMSDAMVTRTMPLDFDLCTQTGLYIVAPENGLINYPPGAYEYGTLIVATPGGFGVQVYIPDSGIMIYVRTYYARLGWRPWRSLTTTAV